MQELVELSRTWGFAFLGALLVTVAFLVNKLAPQKRRRLRHALLLYIVFVMAAASWHLVRLVHVPGVAAWNEHFGILCDLLGAFTLVNIATLAVFDVALPVLGVSFVAITGDLVVFGAYVFAALGVLKAAGVSPSSVVTTSAVASGVLALGLQTTLGNVIGGVALQIDGSIDVGDWLQLADGQQGRVVAIRWRHTVLETRNWDTIVVPNANLLAQNILILGKRNGKPLQHRMWVYFNVDYRHPPSRVIDVVREALCAAPIDGVATDPLPSVICYDLAKDGRDSFGFYAVRYFLTDLANDDPTSSCVRGRVYTALKRAGIPLARPARTLFVKPEEDTATQEARRKDREVRSIERVDLFHALTTEERAFVADHLMYAPFTAGETVTKQGAVAHFLYVLAAGKVEIRRHPEDGGPPKKVATIEAPSFFGEMGLMTGEPRTADVVAITDVDCYRLDKTGLQHILEERPEVAAEFSRILALRRVDLATVLEGLDADAKRARVATEETRILDRIQEFFGLARTMKV
jgi:small-conductance mechanosensitive channel/CRP-like cAMP-binding protein